MLTTALFLLAMTAQDKLPDVQMGKAQLCFLVDPSPNVVKVGDVHKMKAQDEFLEELWKKRTALLVGPLKDAGARKAIVLLDVEKADEAKKILSEYPGVSKGE